MSQVPSFEIPPRPAWLPRRRPAGSLQVRTSESLPDEVLQRRTLRGWGNISSGVMVSAAIHVAILLLLNLWYFVIRPAASGYVINCEILTEDEGAQTAVNTVVHAALPDAPPPGGDIRLDPQRGGGSSDGKIARLGGGGQGDGEGAGGGGVGFFGTKARGNSFVFVVDRSGSMKNQGRLTAAKRELNRAIGTLDPQQQFFVLFYNDHSRPMLDTHAPDAMVLASADIKDEVRRWMRPIQADGGTEPAESLRTALKMRPDIIFLLTDGEIPEETGDVVRAANSHGTVVHTTALVSQEGEAILQQISHQSGGTYRYIPAVPGIGSDNEMHQLAQNERAAEAKLRLARKYFQLGRPRTGRRWLEEVVDEFPGTPQATQAEQLLSAL